ncbi:MAG: SDR family NAD(P)-dependent oxidoreductase [Bryobacteraceae bacterium]
MPSKLFDLSGRVAVVMGGTSGIGRTLAGRLAEAGANVVATGRRENLVPKVADDIEKLGRKTASLTSYVSFFEVAAYAVSKSRLLGLTHSFAIEWAQKGVNVNAIAPGVFRTELNSGLLDGTGGGRELLMRTPMKRFGKVSELVGAAIVLASDAAASLRASVFRLMAGSLRQG